MKVNISQLKARLSAFLDAVRGGRTVTVLDRKTPIARIVPLEEGSGDIRYEAASEAVATIDDVHGVELREPIDVMTLLSESRGER